MPLPPAIFASSLPLSGFSFVHTFTESVAKVCARFHEDSDPRAIDELPDEALLLLRRRHAALSHPRTEDLIGPQKVQERTSPIHDLDRIK